MQKKIKIGVFGIGLDTYWPQFDGLLERLKGYQSQIVEKIAGFGMLVVDAGLVDSPEKARDAADRFKTEDVELIFLYISTYALSSTVLPVVQKAKVPVVVLNLQPVPAIGYEKFNALGDRGVMTGEWQGASKASMNWMVLGLTILIIGIVIIALGNAMMAGA